MDERDPAQPTDEPRRKTVGDQLPEEAPDDHVDRPREDDPDAARDRPQDDDPGAGHARTTPTTSSPQDGDPQQATGNPHAAG